MTLTEVHGADAESVLATSYRGVTTEIGPERLRLEIVAPDGDARAIAATVAGAAATGRPGDGLVTIGPVAECVAIRTGLRGVGALRGRRHDDDKSLLPPRLMWH